MNTLFRTLGRSLLVAAVLFLSACADADTPSADEAAETGLVEITARGLTLSGPSETQSGWTTIRFNNESEMIHLVVVERLPDGRTAADQQQEIAPIFQEGMDLLNEGQFDEAMAAFGKLPEWFGEIGFLGGPGLTSAGGATEATMFLEPGTYLLECYVKTNGIFHSYNPVEGEMGMVHEMAVLDEPSGADAPESTVELTLSSTRGIEFPETISAGDHTFAVFYEDQVVHENFLGHDVHLARITEDTDLDNLGVWVDWTQPTGLETPAPVPFLGGVNEMPEGQTAYFTATLEPGMYAFVSEVSGAAGKNMLTTFEVE